MLQKIEPKNPNRGRSTTSTTMMMTVSFISMARQGWDSFLGWVLFLTRESAFSLKRDHIKPRLGADIGTLNACSVASNI